MDKAIRDRITACLTAIGEAYDVHIGCGGEVYRGFCGACNKRPAPSQICIAYALDEQGTAEILADRYTEDVGALLRELETLRASLPKPDSEAENRVCGHCQNPRCLGCDWDSCEQSNCPGCARIKAHHGLP